MPVVGLPVCSRGPLVCADCLIKPPCLSQRAAEQVECCALALRVADLASEIRVNTPREYPKTGPTSV